MSWFVGQVIIVNSKSYFVMSIRMDPKKILQKIAVPSQKVWETLVYVNIELIIRHFLQTTGSRWANIANISKVTHLWSKEEIDTSHKVKSSNFSRFNMFNSLELRSVFLCVLQQSKSKKIYLKIIVLCQLHKINKYFVLYYYLFDTEIINN